MLQFAQDKITAVGYQQRWAGTQADFGNFLCNIYTSEVPVRVLSILHRLI